MMDRGSRLPVNPEQDYLKSVHADKLIAVNEGLIVFLHNCKEFERIQK